MTVEVPRVVTIDRCALEASELPDVAPVEADKALCVATFGDGALCFDTSNGWRVKALIDALKETWLAVKACEEAN